jgi:hypothetical protein
MKLKLAFAVVAAFFVLVGSAQSYVEYPTIHEGEAESHAVHVLHDYPGWRYRNYGYVDCRNGRLNNYSWACRVGWISGSKCRQGRIRVENEYSEGRTIYYRSHTVLRRC